MVPKLYMVWGSPPVHAVLMTAKLINFDLDLIELDFSKNQSNDEWFLQLNPSHTVPVLDDNGFVVWDSHTIMIYLLEKYGNNHKLFPNDERKYKIMQILNFDCGSIFRRMSECIRPLIYENQTKVNEKCLENLKDVYETLERILSKSTYFADDHCTLADISVFSTVLATKIVFPLDEFIHLNKWFKHLKEMTMYESIDEGMKRLESAVKAQLAKNT